MKKIKFAFLLSLFLPFMVTLCCIQAHAYQCTHADLVYVYQKKGLLYDDGPCDQDYCYHFVEFAASTCNISSNQDNTAIFFKCLKIPVTGGPRKVSCSAVKQCRENKIRFLYDGYVTIMYRKEIDQKTLKYARSCSG